jgi:hypothetical protein
MWMMAADCLTPARKSLQIRLYYEAPRLLSRPHYTVRVKFPTDGTIYAISFLTTRFEPMDANSIAHSLLKFKRSLFKNTLAFQTQADIQSCCHHLEKLQYPLRRTNHSFVVHVENHANFCYFDIHLKYVRIFSAAIVEGIMSVDLESQLTTIEAEAKMSKWAYSVLGLLIIFIVRAIFQSYFEILIALFMLAGFWYTFQLDKGTLIEHVLSLKRLDFENSPKSG